MADDTRSVVVRLRAEAGQFVGEFDRAARSGDKLERSMGRNTQSMGRLIRQARNLALGAGIGKLVVDSVKLEAQYSKTMAQVAVATQAPQAQLKELDRLALQLGASTVFSAGEAADAMLSLAKGGLTTAEIQAGALADTLTLASAGDLELADAADTVVQAMGAFRLGADETNRATAALAGGANASAASVSDMRLALSQVGTVANDAGFTIEETTAYLAAFANQGFKGSDAGTSLKTMLGQLVPNTKEAASAMDALNLSYLDGNGNLVDAEEIARRTQEAFKNLSDEERISAAKTIFGNDARRAVAALVAEGDEGIRKYTKSTSDLTQAQKLADAANSGTAGALENLKGAVETAQIQIGKGLAPVVQDAAEKLAGFVSSGDAEEFGRDFAEGIRNLVTELAPLAKSLFETGQDALPLVKDGLTATADAIGLVLDVAGPLLDMFNSLPQGAKDAALLAGALLLLNRQTAGLRTNVGNAVLNLRTMPTEMRNARVQAAAMRGGVGLAGLGLSAFGSQIGDTNSKIGTVASTLGAAAVGFTVAGPWGAAIAGGVSLLSGFGGANEDTVADVDSLTAALDRQNGSLTENARNMLVAALQKDGAYTDAAKVGVSAGDVTDSVLGNEAAQGRINARAAEYLDLLGQARDRALEARARLPETAPQADLDAADEALRQANDRYREGEKAVNGLNDSLDRQSGALGEAKNNYNQLTAAQRESIEFNKLSTEQAAAVSAAVKDIPKEAVTKLTTPGYDKAKSNIVSLAREYDLTPKEVRTLMETLDYASGDIRNVIRRLKDLDDDEANPKVNVNAGNSFDVLAAIQERIRGLRGKSVAIGITGAGAGLALSGDGGYTGMLIGPGYAGGGRVPGIPPADPRMDNVQAYGATGRPLRVRSGEWIINEPQSRKNDPWLRAINSGMDLGPFPGAAMGGRYGVATGAAAGADLSGIGAAVAGGVAAALAGGRWKADRHGTLSLTLAQGDY